MMMMTMIVTRRFLLRDSTKCFISMQQKGLRYPSTKEKNDIGEAFGYQIPQIIPNSNKLKPFRLPKRNVHSQRLKQKKGSFKKRHLLLCIQGRYKDIYFNHHHS